MIFVWKVLSKNGSFFWCWLYDLHLRVIHEVSLTRSFPATWPVSHVDDESREAPPPSESPQERTYRCPADLNTQTDSRRNGDERGGRCYYTHFWCWINLVVVGGETKAKHQILSDYFQHCGPITSFMPESLWWRGTMRLRSQRTVETGPETPRSNRRRYNKATPRPAHPPGNENPLQTKVKYQPKMYFMSNLHKSDKHTFAETQSRSDVMNHRLSVSNNVHPKQNSKRRQRR